LTDREAATVRNLEYAYEEEELTEQALDWLGWSMWLDLPGRRPPRQRLWWSLGRVGLRGPHDCTISASSIVGSSEAPIRSLLAARVGMDGGDTEEGGKSHGILSSRTRRRQAIC
jgi:hypothetical protein